MVRFAGLRMCEVFCEWWIMMQITGMVEWWSKGMWFEFFVWKLERGDHLFY